MNAFALGLLLAFFAIREVKPTLNRNSNVLEFIILHNNDMHARFEQTSSNTGKCLSQDANTNKCYGGFARTAHTIRKYRTDAENGGIPTIYLNAGDTYTGTPWFTIFKDNITTEFLNILSPDAISLGNHEFDDGVEGLVPFLNRVNFPVLAANLNLSKVPEMAGVTSLKKSTVININGTKVGVIGYLTPDTKKLAKPNKVEFISEVAAINEEAEKLRLQGIQIIIALGHSGFLKDKEIAKNCPDVDIVIGGHTNTFLYNGNQPDAENSEGPYPTLVRQVNGKEVPVVQAYAFTKYLGKMYVKFDKYGNLLEFDGQPILLNADIPRDSDVLKLLEKYRPNITSLEEAVVGRTNVDLDGRREICRIQECNLGNLIADSMVYARSKELEGGLYWTDAAIAFIQGGGIRNSVIKRSDGSLTESDIFSVLPFQNNMFLASVSGKIIRNALERSAAIYDTDSNGGFLQMSGVRVVYDTSRNVGCRVLSAEVLCAECNVPNYSSLDENKMYNVILSEFLLYGGDGHDFQNEVSTLPIRLKLNEIEALSTYISQRTIIYPGIDGRINFENSKSNAATFNRIFSVFNFLIIIEIAVLCLQ